MLRVTLKLQLGIEKKIFKHIGKYDLILPYHKKVIGKSKTRLLLSRFYTFLVNLASGKRIKYYNGLCIAKKTDFIKKMIEMIYY